jgi:hypothetical protein
VYEPELPLDHDTDMLLLDTLFRDAEGAVGEVGGGGGGASRLICKSTETLPAVKLNQQVTLQLAEPFAELAVITKRFV